MNHVPRVTIHIKRSEDERFGKVKPVSVQCQVMFGLSCCRVHLNVTRLEHFDKKSSRGRNGSSPWSGALTMPSYHQA